MRMGKAVTLVEIVVVVVVIGILATLGLPVYQNIVEDSQAKVCETNLKALKAALDIYAMDHDTMPASLSSIPAKYIRIAYGRIFSEKDAWKTKLAYFIVDWKNKGLAYAAHELAGGNMDLVSCPKDPTPPKLNSADYSYGVNSLIYTDVDRDGRSGTSRDYQAIPSGTLLIGDKDAATFSGATDLTERHIKHGILTQRTYGQAVDTKKDIKQLQGGVILEHRISSIVSTY